MALQAEAKKRKLDSAERDDGGKVKKVKKEKKVRRDKNEKVRSTLSGIDCCHSVWSASDLSPAELSLVERGV